MTQYKTHKLSIVSATKYYVALIALPFLLFIGCLKDVYPDGIASPCEPLPPPGPGPGYNFVFDSLWYMEPQFNPNDNDDILFLEWNFKLGIKSLVKYDMISKHQVKIAEKNIFGTSRWHKNDWILFGTSSGNIFKVKSDGSNLTQLTNTGTLFHPVWSPDGKRFAALFSGESQKSYILSDEGTVLDSIPFDISRTCNWNKNYLSRNQSFRVEIFDLETKQVYQSYKFAEPENYSVNGTAIWLNDSNLVWASASGIKLGDIHFAHVKDIWYSCPSRQYLTGDISSTGGNMIWHRRTETAIDEFNATVKNEIVLIDIEGTKEEVVPLP